MLHVKFQLRWHWHTIRQALKAAHTSDIVWHHQMTHTSSFWGTWGANILFWEIQDWSLYLQTAIKYPPLFHGKKSDILPDTPQLKIFGEMQKSDQIFHWANSISLPDFAQLSLMQTSLVNLK
jgi:hypothetical protein